MYDFRFDTKLMQSFVGLQITSYKCTDTITEMVDIQIGDNVYCLINEYEELDYFLLENENTVYRISIVIGKALKLSPPFPPPHTGRATFIAPGVPSN